MKKFVLSKIVQAFTTTCRKKLDQEVQHFNKMQGLLYNSQFPRKSVQLGKEIKGQMKKTKAGIVDPPHFFSFWIPAWKASNAVDMPTEEKVHTHKSHITRPLPSLIQLSVDVDLPISQWPMCWLSTKALMIQLTFHLSNLNN